MPLVSTKCIFYFRDVPILFVSILSILSFYSTFLFYFKDIHSGNTAKNVATNNAFSINEMHFLFKERLTMTHLNGITSDAIHKKKKKCSESCFFYFLF